MARIPVMAWITAKSPIDDDYYKQYSNLRYLYQTVAAVCASVKPKKFYLIGLARRKAESICPDGDIILLVNLLKKVAPKTEFLYKSIWDEGLPKTIDLAIASSLWGWGYWTILQEMYALRDKVLSKCNSIIYCDVDRELDKVSGSFTLPKNEKFLEWAKSSYGDGINEKVEEVWTTEHHEGYREVLESNGYNPIYVPYIGYPLKNKPRLDGEYKWVFINNPGDWVPGKADEFFAKFGDKCLWYIAGKGPGIKRAKFFRDSGINIEQAKFWKVPELKGVYRKGLRVFHCSGPFNIITRKLGEALSSGITTTLPKLDRSLIGDHYYDLYKRYAKKPLSHIIVDASDKKTLGSRMVEITKLESESEDYPQLVEFHNEYHNPENISNNNINSRVLKEFL